MTPPRTGEQALDDLDVELGRLGLQLELAERVVTLGRSVTHVLSDPAQLRRDQIVRAAVDWYHASLEPDKPERLATARRALAAAVQGYEHAGVPLGRSALHALTGALDEYDAAKRARS